MAGLRRLKPIQVPRQPPLTPIETSRDEIMKARLIAIRIARGNK